MKFLKTTLLLLFALLLIAVILCSLLIFEVIKLGNQINDEINNDALKADVFDFFLSAGIILFAMIMVYALIYAFVIAVNYRSVKRGRGRFFNIYTLITNIPETIYWVSLSIATLSVYDWSNSYTINLLIALMICVGFILVIRLVYSVTALVCSNKNERDLDKEKEDRLVQRISTELGHNPYRQYNNPPTQYFDQNRKR